MRNDARAAAVRDLLELRARMADAGADADALSLMLDAAECLRYERSPRLPDDADAAAILPMVGGGRVLPGATVDLGGQPQLPFKPRSLYIPRRYARWFVVQRLAIGITPCTLASGDLSALWFSRTGGAPFPSSRVVEPQVRVTLSVTNIGARPHAFHCVCAGEVVDGAAAPPKCFP